ncbi:unnamed protein product [Prunus armeniaca]
MLMRIRSNKIRKPKNKSNVRGRVQIYSMKEEVLGDKQDEIMQEHAQSQQSIVNPEYNSGDYYPSPHNGGY